VTHSFEQFYQAIRRSWRFGVDGAVDVHIVSSELEGRVVESLKLKQAKADALADETRRHVLEHVRQNVAPAARQSAPYKPTKLVRWPLWLRSEEA